MTKNSIPNNKTKEVGSWQLEWNTEKEKHFNRNRLYNLVIILFSLGIFSVFILAHKTLVPALEISKLVAFLCVIGLLIPWRFYHKWFGWYKMDIFIVNLFGIGPFLSGLLLAANFFIHSPKEVERYKISQSYIEGYKGMFGAPKLLIELEGNAYQNQRELLLFDLEEIGTNKKPQFITYTFADGLFGYRVVLDWEMEY